MKKKHVWMAIALSAAMMLAGCGSAASSQAVTSSSQTSSGSSSATASTASGASAAASADTLRAILASEPNNLDPHNNTRLTAWAVQEEIFDKLVTKDESGNILPDVATKWEQINDTTWRFYLRQDVKFHDGSKLTAADVAFSLKRACEMSGSKTFFVQFDADKIAAVDDYTVDVVTKQAFAPVLNYLATARGAILCKAAVESMGDEAYGRAPVGSGPFKITSWNTGESIVLTRNEDYWGTKPSYTTLQFRFVTEASNRAIELETGGADIIYNVAANDAVRLASASGVKVVSGPAYTFVYVSMNMRDPVLQNEKLREALTYATDIPALVDALYGDSAKVADSYMSTSVAMHASMPAKTFDLDKAKQLMAEAGYANGLTLTIKLAEDRTFASMAEILQSMWGEIGVTVDIQSMEQATYLDQANSGQVQIGMASTNAVSGDPDNGLFIWRSTAVNAIQPNDTKIDAYLDKGSSTFDTAQRAAVYKEVQQYLWDKDYGIPLCFPNVTYGISSKVSGFVCSPGNIPDLALVTISK